MPVEPWVLIADIGGTNARFCSVSQGQGGVSAPVILATRDYETFDDALTVVFARLGGVKGLTAIILAVAGPVDGAIVKLTNANWLVDVPALRHTYAIDSIEILNDFTALALALPHLEANDLHFLQRGKDEVRGCLAVIGPGTGLGVSGLIALPQGGWLPVQGEGGHVTYAPETDVEWRVAQELRRRYGRVSAERVISGQGLVDTAWVLGARESINTPALVVSAAKNEACSACQQAIEVFLTGLGRAAGDLALFLGARAVFIGGGILPKMVANYDLSTIIAAFCNKGRNTSRMEQIPVALVVTDNPALIGLSARAREGLPSHVSPVVPATVFATLPGTTQNRSGAGRSTWAE